VKAFGNAAVAGEDRPRVPGRAAGPLRVVPSPLCFGNIVPGVFQPVLAKHSKYVSLQNELSIGVDQMQGNFDGMRAPVLKAPCPSISATVAVRG